MDVKAFFTNQGKSVLTFTGYSGSGYEDEGRMLEDAKRVLSRFDKERTIINIGATSDGIGAVYKVAKSMGFTTTGIVSTLARTYNAPISPDVDHVFFIEDDTWGGFLESDTERLSPTSQAMVENSDVLVGIGGGEVSRDELIAARNAGVRVVFIPAEMNHQIAQDKAEKKGLPPLSDFRGAAHVVFSTP